jgi:hypothetical protein
MGNLYSVLGDSFDSPVGQMNQTWDTSLVNITRQPHYTLRSFRNDTVLAPWTMADMSYWNNDHFNTFLQSDLEAGRSFSAGEAWSTVAGVTYGKDATLRYMPTLTASVPVGTPKTATSLMTDDIVTGLSGTHYVEVALPSFPAQAAAVHLDLANSFIDFSSDPTFATQTDSFRFNQSLNSLTAGGNVYFQIDRASLVNSNPANLQGVRFRLVAAGTGTMTFKAAALRVVPSSYLFPANEIDTKFGFFTRAIPRAGQTEPSLTDNTMLFPVTQPKNITMYARFNSGHNPTGNDNSLTIRLRHKDANNYITVTLNARDTQSRLIINEVVSGVTTTISSTSINTNILTEEANYFLVVSLYDTTISAAIYNSYGSAQRGSQVYTTGNQTLSRVGRGYIGYNFQPYNYDFTLDFIQAEVAQFAFFQSTAFPSVMPVRGARLVTKDSGVFDLLNGASFTNYGDSSITLNQSIGGRGSAKVVRTGATWVGGLMTSTSQFFGSPSEAVIQGAIYVPSQVRGTYRIALLDLYGSVAWMAEASGLTPNHWNNFEIPLSGEILPNNYFLHVQQAGLYADTFYVADLKALHQTVDWSLSADNGVTWQRTLNAINSTHAGVKFNVPGNRLMVKAIALSDQAYIQGYELIPIYQLSVH